MIKDFDSRKRQQETKKSENMEQFIRKIAHEFNNHLSVMKSYLGLIGRDKNLNEQVRNDLVEVKTVVEKATLLTSQLLSFASSKKFHAQPINLNSYLFDLQSKLNAVLGNQVEIKVGLDATEDGISADGASLEQIIFNLAANAREAMNSKGVFSLKTENMSGVGKESSSRQSYVCLLVSDQGRGIDSRNLKQIFEPFFTTSRDGQKTGLGLSIVESLVTQMKGTIEVESVLGKGTTFKIYFPLTSNMSENPNNESESFSEAAKNKSILIVDDNMALRRAFSRILKKEGYRVFTAKDPLEALRKSGEIKQNLSLLLTDLDLPEMNGVQLADRVKLLCAGVKIIFLTGYSDPSDIVEGINEKKENILMKPIDADMLTKKIRVVLNLQAAA